MDNMEHLLDYSEQMAETLEGGYVYSLWSLHQLLEIEISKKLWEVGQEEGLGSDNFLDLTEKQQILYDLKFAYFPEYVDTD